MVDALTAPRDMARIAPRIHSLRDCPAIYLDPIVSVAPETVDEIRFSKHFRFAYQTEHRFVLTTLGTTQLTPLFLELGSLEDIAEIVTAPDELAVQLAATSA